MVSIRRASSIAGVVFLCPLAVTSEKITLPETKKTSCLFTSAFSRLSSKFFLVASINNIVELVFDNRQNHHLRRRHFHRILYLMHNIFDMNVSLGTDDEERDFESFAVLDDGDIDLSETLHDESISQQ
jgi:hypothetical protein